MVGRDHHRALKTEVVGRLNAGRAQMALAALQAGKSDKWFTLHVNPTSFSTAGLQPTDWLAYLGFRRNDKCNFTESQRCYSREVHQEFDLQQFATAFNAGFGYLKKAQNGLQACGFMLPQPEGWGFYFGRNGGSERRRYHTISGDGHTATKKDTMKATEDEQFLFRFTFIDTGAEEAFVTHYRPKHSPISSELHSALSHLGLKAFDDCPEFDFERCYFRTLRLAARDDAPWSGNVEYAHRCFDAHQAQFSPAIENLLAANAAVETVGITFLPFEKAGARVSADIASNVRRAGKPKPAAASSKLP